MSSIHPLLEQAGELMARDLALAVEYTTASQGRRHNITVERKRLQRLIARLHDDHAQTMRRERYALRERHLDALQARTAMVRLAFDGRAMPGRLQEQMKLLRAYCHDINVELDWWKLEKAVDLAWSMHSRLEEIQALIEGIRLPDRDAVEAAIDALPPVDPPRQVRI